MWMWFQLWMFDVTIVGYPVACIYLASYAPLGVWVVRRARRGRLGRRLPFAVLAVIVIGAMEYLKDTVVFNGYPWYGLGQPLIECRTISQIADFGGAVVASLLTALVGGAMIDLWRWRAGHWSADLRGNAVVGVSMAVILVASSVIYGSWRLDQTSRSVVDGPRVLAVQTNIATDNKIGWTRDRQESDVLEFGRITIALADEQREKGTRIDLVVWPETMLPGFGLEPKTIETLVAGDWWPGDRFASFISVIQRHVGVPMLVGSPVFLGLRADAGHWAWDQQFNSAYLIDGDPPFERYDKVFLTPFGETMPYISNWTWLEERMLAIGARGMTFDLDEGRDFRRISVEWGGLNGNRHVVQCATPICFEDTLPSVVRRLVHGANGAKEAQLIINISNDGWFGFSDWARAQHALIARWRCIENRTPMIRVANTGLSQAFTSEGAVVEGATVAARSLGGFSTTVQLDARTTVFGQLGDVLSPIMALSALILIIRNPLRRKQVAIVQFLATATLGWLVVQSGGGCDTNSPTHSALAGTSWSSRPVSTTAGSSAGDTSSSGEMNQQVAPVLESAPEIESGNAAPIEQVEAENVVATPTPTPTPAPTAAAHDDSKGPPKIGASASTEQLAIAILEAGSKSDAPIFRAHALEGLQSRPTIVAPIACRLLADQNPGVRFAAAVTVGKKRIADCINTVEPLTLDPNPSVRAAAIYALVRLGKLVDLNPLAELAMSSDPEIRSNALFVLGELHNPSAIALVESTLGRRMIGADQTRVRIVELQAAEAMAKMGDYRQFDPIRAALFAPSEQAEVIALACQMIGEVNDRGARGHLIGLWNGKGPLARPVEIRLIVGAALVRIGETNVEPILQLCSVCVRNPSPEIRCQAVATLGWVGDQRAIDAIAPLLNDPVPIVSMTAAAAYLRATMATGALETFPLSGENLR